MLVSRRMEFPIISWLIIITTLFVVDTSGKHKAFFYPNVTFIGNKKFMNDTIVKINCDTITRKSPCNLTPQVIVSVVSEVTRPYFYLKVINLKTNKKFIEQVINVCSLTKQPGINLFVRLFFEQLTKNSNFEFGCPFPKGVYEVDGFQISPTFDLLLNFFAVDEPHSIRLVGRNKNRANMEPLFTFTYDFEVVEIGE